MKLKFKFPASESIVNHIEREARREGHDGVLKVLSRRYSTIVLQDLSELLWILGFIENNGVLSRFPVMGNRLHKMVKGVLQSEVRKIDASE